MSLNNSPHDPDVAKALKESLSNIALALAASFLASRLLFWLGAAPGMILFADLIVFFTIIYADPFAALRNTRPVREVAVKLAVGAMIGGVTAGAVSLMDFGTVTETVGAAAAATPPAGLPWHMLIVFLIIPLVFFGPLLERVLTRGSGTAPVTADELRISAAFPIFITCTMVLNLAVPGALWLLDAPLSLAFTLMLAAVLICVAETWTADPEDLIEDIDDDQWGPRAGSVGEARAGLHKALRQSMPSALFVGAMIYVSIRLTAPYLPDFNLLEVDMLGWMLAFLTATGVMMVSFILLCLLGMLALAAAVIALGHRHGTDPFSAAELLKQAQVRLLAGGMHWVRPDFEND